MKTFDKAPFLYIGIVCLGLGLSTRCARQAVHDAHENGYSAGQCDADCRWVHDEGRYDSPVRGVYDPEQDTCGCIRTLDEPEPRRGRLPEAP